MAFSPQVAALGSFGGMLPFGQGRTSPMFGAPTAFDPGTQNITAPALASAMGSLQGAGIPNQQSQPYSPGPSFYREYLDLMKQAQTAAEPSGGFGEGFMELLSALMMPQQLPQRGGMANAFRENLVGSPGFPRIF